MSDDFYRGLAVALTIIAQADKQTLFDEICRSVDAKKLIAVARKDGVLRISGFTRYGYTRMTQ